jgi:hypothetical protein
MSYRRTVAEGSYDHYVPKFLLKRFSRRENAAMLNRLHVQKGQITDAQVRTEVRTDIGVGPRRDA